MAISRAQMRQQVSKPPSKGMTNGKKEKDKKRRLLSQSKKPLQSMALRLRFGGVIKVPQGGRKKLGKLY